MLREKICCVVGNNCLSFSEVQKQISEMYLFDDDIFSKEEVQSELDKLLKDGVIAMSYTKGRFIEGGSAVLHNMILYAFESIHVREGVPVPLRSYIIQHKVEDLYPFSDILGDDINGYIHDGVEDCMDKMVDSGVLKAEEKRRETSGEYGTSQDRWDFEYHLVPRYCMVDAK